MKRLLIDLEENSCTVKEAVDYLKGLGYREDDEILIPYNATLISTYSNGVIDSYVGRDFDLANLIRTHRFEKITIKEKQGDQGDSLMINLSTDQALFLYHALMEYPLVGLSEGIVDIFNGAFEKVEHCVSSGIGFDPVCVKTPSEREMNGDEFFRFSYAVKDEMMKSEQEKPIVFSNPLMRHIGREVVVNIGEVQYTGWVVDYEHSNNLLVDFGFKITNYTHDGSGHGDGTVRWFHPLFLKFVNEDGSLSDD